MKVKYRHDAKLVVIAFSAKIIKPHFPTMFAETQVLIMIEGHTIKSNEALLSFEVFTRAEEFVSTDQYETPELYWPQLKFKYSKFSIENFPLIMGSGSPTTGLLVYFKTAFEKYYENRRDQKIERHRRQKSKFLVIAQVVPYVSESMDGYPLKDSNL